MSGAPKGAVPFLWALMGAVLGALLVTAWRPPPAPPPPVSVADPAVVGAPGDASRISVAAGAIAQAVVNIDVVTRTSGDVRDLDPLSHGEGAPAAGKGSGVVISPDGDILTNHHVVGKAEKIRVTLPDGKTFEARVVGTDPMTDLAVLKMEPDAPLAYATFGDSDRVQVGDWVVAVGNPYGFGHTVTVGVLSGRERELPGGSQTRLSGLLQTDAAINPGNSGGPLANLKGEVIGINTAIIPFARGIGFAVPSNTAAEVADILSKEGKVVRPYLGVQMEDLTEETIQLLELPTDSGVVVTKILLGSPAATAGVEEGDVLLEVDGQVVGSSEELQKVVRGTQPGQTVKLKLFRKGSQQELEVRIAEMPDAVPPG